MAKTWHAAAIVAALAGVAWASGGWDDAKRKADDAKSKGDEARKQFVAGTKKVVGAMCAGKSIDELKSIGQSETSNVRGDVRSKLDDYHRTVKDAVDLLEHVDSKDSHHSDASSLASQLKQDRDKLDDRTRKLVDGSAEFVEKIANTAASAKGDRRGRCSQKEFSADGERINCLIKESDTCYVVETTLDNSNAISNARDRARRGGDHIKSELKKSSPGREVNGCVRVEPRVDCLKVCPDVGDDGRVSDPRASWRERC